MSISAKTLKTIETYGLDACINDFRSNEFDGNGASGIVGAGDVKDVIACNARIEAGSELAQALKSP